MPYMVELHSRIHTLPSFQTEKVKVFLKREDELGFGISGCKRRKYLSLIPFLQAEKYELVHIIGGENSNNLVGLAQALNEAKIPFVAYIKAQKNTQKQGNSFLLQLLTKPEQRIYIPAEKWVDVEAIASNDLLLSEKKGYLIPEGASCAPSIDGLCTLMTDIQRNETECGIHFEHIFIDAGTAYTAAVLVAMNQLLAQKKQIHIVYAAGDTQLFEQQYNNISDYFSTKNIIINPDYQTTTTHYFPITARSFGSVNATIKQAILDFAQTEGILTDPIYSAKLLLTAKHIIRQDAMTGNVLIIHSGGGTGLMGFSSWIS